MVQSIIGLKNRLRLGIHWTNQLANELHNPVRRRFVKRTVFAKQVDDIWTADLVDMSPFSRSNKGYKYLLTVIDVFSKYGWIVPLKTKTGKEVAQAFRNVLYSEHSKKYIDVVPIMLKGITIHIIDQSSWRLQIHITQQTINISPC